MQAPKVILRPWVSIIRRLFEKSDRFVFVLWKYSPVSIVIGEATLRARMPLVGSELEEARSL